MGNVTRNENGRVTSVYGLPVRIESVAGSYRIKSGRPPILVSDDYGELVGTKGADQDPIDCYVGPYPETNTVYVINQDKQGMGFDEHKVMFGFLDQDHAINVYSLGCFGKKPMSVVACTVSQFKWWLEYGNHTEAMTAQSLPFDSYSETAMQQFPEYDWNNTSAAASRVLYDMRVMDSAYGQLIEANNHRDLLDQIEHQDGGELGVLDALVIPNNQIQKKAAQIGMALNRAASGDIKVVEEGGVEVTEPYRQGGTTNIAMLFSMSDGQTVSVFFHNPDVTPNKLSPDDSMVSWKWMLNKKDITIVVAKENGQDQSISAIAKKIMALVEANATKFARANAKAAESEAEIKATEERIEQKKNVLQGLLEQIAAIESGHHASNTPNESDWFEKALELIQKNDKGGVQSLSDDDFNVMAEALESENYHPELESFKAMRNADISKPNTAPIELTGKELGDFDVSTKEGMDGLRDAAYQYLRALFTNHETVFCRAINSDVNFNSSGTKKFKKLSGHPVKNQLAIAIKQIIADGDLIKGNIQSYSTEEQKMGITYDVLRTKVVVEGIEYGARTVIRKLPDGKYHYDLQVKDSFEAIMDGVKTMGEQSMSAYESDVIVHPMLGSEDLENHATHDDGTSQVFDKAGIQTDTFVLNLFIDVKNENGEWVELEDTFEPEETDESGHDADRAFLQEVIEGLVDVMGEGFHERMTAVALRYNGGDNTEMQTMVEQAVNAYTAKLDELSQ